MSDNLKAISIAAGLSPEEQKKVDEFNKALSVHKELLNVPADAANKKYNSLTPAQQASLQKNFGNEDPAVQEKRSPLGTAWHYTFGLAGAAIGGGAGKVLAGLENVSDVMTRAYRTVAIAGDQGVGIGDAWVIANDKGDKVFSPDRINNAKVKFGNEFEDEIKIISFLFQKMIKRELSYVSEFSCLVKFFLWVNFENSRIDVLIIF